MAEVLRFLTPGPSLSDAEAREQTLNPKASFIVEAPAGSGKTALLVQRFLKLLAEDSPGYAIVAPEEVLAMTFTRKATAEMSERILGELRAAHDNTPLRENASRFEQETRSLATAVLKRSRDLGWDLLSQPQRLNIRSILSVCMELANSMPLLAAGSAPYKPVDNPSSLYRHAARRTLMLLGSDDYALHEALGKLLLHRDGSLLSCEQLIASMLATREQWAELIPLSDQELTDEFLDREVRPKLERALENIVCVGLARATKAMPAGLLEELASLASRLAVHHPYKFNISPIAICASKPLPPQAAVEHLDHWLALLTLVLKKDHDWRKRLSRSDVGFEIPKPDQTYLEQLVASIQNDALHEALKTVRALPHAKYPDEQWAVAKGLFRILRRALAELKVLFAERGECDFTELALAARDVLAPGNTSADLYLTAGGRLRHLLVDEMQDTSTGQYDLIRLLTQSWDGHSQTLFLVGDPKQSIYLFRQARVERFLRTFDEARLGDVPLTPLRLTANFRSQQTLVENFNQTFDRIFPSPGDASLHGGDAVDVPFVEATAVRKPSHTLAIQWHPAIFGEEVDETHSTGDERQDRELQQARHIRTIIEYWLNKPLPIDRKLREDGTALPWQIAIVARVRNHLAPIVAELKRDYGRGDIPFRALDLDPLNERPEVQDALALTRALLHPADRIAWLAVLRAPWCGLSLADLLALAGDDPTTTISSLIASRRNLLSAEGQSLLARAWLTLEPAITTLGSSAFSTHVERTWRSLGGDVFLNVEQLANVLTFFKLLQKLEAQDGRIDLSLLDEQLKKLFAEPRHGDIHVELLTIHAAKGLEWDVVLVPGLERRTRSATSVLLNWLELDAPSSQQEASIVLAPIWGKGEDSDKLNDWLRSLRNRRERAEEKRLFYVACTRAREELHLFAACKRNDNGGVAQPNYGTLLSACWPAAQEHLIALQSAASPTNVITMPQPVAEESPLALAAGAEQPAPTAPQPPILQRLPLAFNPLARFEIPLADRLPYPTAAALPHAPAFDRPEGGFAVRAFGNVVHRFLQLISTHLESGTAPETLLAELPTWQPRLITVLRAEGLAPAAARRDAPLALQALEKSLTDPIGRWLLSPHASSVSEQPLTSTRLQDLRADRTFFAGPEPLSSANSDFWIVDFKTATTRSLSTADFETAELAKYRPQLEAYARIRRSILPAGMPIHLALYYPLIPRLIHWQSTVE